MTFERPIYLFSYGTLRLPEVQKAVFGRELAGEPDALLGFDLASIAIADDKVAGISGSAVHPILRPSTDPAAEVNGEALPITKDDVEAADNYETAAYRRQEVILRSGKSAFVYVAARD